MQSRPPIQNPPSSPSLTLHSNIHLHRLCHLLLLLLLIRSLALRLHRKHPHAGQGGAQMPEVREPLAPEDMRLLAMRPDDMAGADGVVHSQADGADGRGDEGGEVALPEWSLAAVRGEDGGGCFEEGHVLEELAEGHGDDVREGGAGGGTPGEGHVAGLSAALEIGVESGVHAFHVPDELGVLSLQGQVQPVVWELGEQHETEVAVGLTVDAGHVLADQRVHLEGGSMFGSFEQAFQSVIVDVVDVDARHSEMFGSCPGACSSPRWDDEFSKETKREMSRRV
ncbi:hypothetical protein KC360_g130 [Hortaea werneckii]|nr:hypothetical protein KC360_g130 [Hortaea werneckii]